jgi:dUTP pyrophosphatase
MLRIAEFEKVSFKQFRRGFEDVYGGTPENEIREVYGSLTLPVRATQGSAGYDFYLPHDLTLHPGESARIPTGIRVRMEEGWVLLLFPRSGLGFKYRLQLDNTVGVIDSDYYGSDNEGHIFAAVTNDSNSGKTLSLKAGSAFMQGVFVPFGVTESDDVCARRNGGFGSTSET